MAIVRFSSELQKLTGEERTVIKASVYRDLVSAVVAKYPRLELESLMKMAVAVDGEIIHDPLLEVIHEDSEVHFLYRIAGG